MARIAILWHNRMPRFRIKRYQIFQLGQIWAEQGHEVVHLLGMRKTARPFDLCFLHVDLTITPASYAHFAREIASIVLNSNLLDISKRKLHHREGTVLGQGPVMLKTDLNCGGRAERWHGMWSGWKLWPRATKGYEIFEDVAAVPSALLSRAGWTLEPFIQDPMAPDGEFWTYSLTCMGSETSTVQIRSTHPEVKGVNSLQILPVPDHQEALKFRDTWRLDYGKLDYILTEKRPRLIDVNKTSGRLPLQQGSTEQRAQVRARLMQRAAALDDVLDGRWTPFG